MRASSACGRKASRLVEGFRMPGKGVDAHSSQSSRYHKNLPPPSILVYPTPTSSQGRSYSSSDWCAADGFSHLLLAYRTTYDKGYLSFLPAAFLCMQRELHTSAETQYDAYLVLKLNELRSSNFFSMQLPATILFILSTSLLGPLLQCLVGGARPTNLVWAAQSVAV